MAWLLPRSQLGRTTWASAKSGGPTSSIRATRALNWRLTRGCPAAGRAESLAQYSRERRRCHRRTVLGDTMTRACLQPAHGLDQREPEQPIAVEQLRPVHHLLVDGELVAQSKVLQGDLTVATTEHREESKQVEQESDH